MNAMPIERKSDSVVSAARCVEPNCNNNPMTNLLPTAEPEKDSKALERDRITLLVCEEIVNGASLAVACERAGVPRSTFLSWLPRHPDVQAQYREARALQVELLVDDINEVCIEARGAKSSEEASAYRLQVDAMKWRAAKLAPRVYGLTPPPDPVPLAPAAPSSPVVLIRYDSPKQLRAPAVHGEVRELAEAVEVDE